MSGVSILVMVGLGGTLIGTKGLPARISPDIHALLEEERFLHDHRDCHFITPLRAETGDICQRGAPDTAPRFVLVGDSHADAFSPAIFAAAETLRISGYQYTQAGFRPLPGIEKQGDPSYSAQTDAFVAFLKARPDLKTVIITAFWQHQITGSTYRHQGDVWFDPGQGDISGQTNRAVTVNGLARLAAMFPERHFVLLDDVPSGYALDLKSYARALLLKSDRRQDSVGLATQEYAIQRSIYEDIFEQIAADTTNMEYRPFFTALCNARICPLFDNNVPIFRNGDHLSVQGALMLHRETEALLKSILSAPPGADHILKN